MNAEIAGIVAVLTVVVSATVKFVGLPDQIRSNFKRKSTDGLSTWFIVSAFVSYVLWTVHGVFAHDWSLIIGQGLGVLTTGVIVGQVLAYRRGKAKAKPSRPGVNGWIHKVSGRMSLDE